MPLVSLIIIPTYNSAKCLTTAVDSVLAQTFKDYELMVVDDDSTDDTRQVLERHKSQSTYIHQEHRERPEARNRGIGASKGECAAFLDVDDLWRPTYLEKQVAARRADVGGGLTHACALVTDRDGRVVGQLRGGPSERADHETLLDALLVLNRFPCCSVVVRKACLEVVSGFYRRLREREDWDLWLRITLGYRVFSVPEPLACQ